MRIHLDEITCPICGITHDHHIDREHCPWLVWDRDICAECEEWADSVKTINLAISQHQTAWYSN